MKKEYRQCGTRFSLEENEILKNEVKSSVCRTVAGFMKKRSLQTVGLDDKALEMVLRFCPDDMLLGEALSRIIIDWTARRDAENIEEINLNTKLFSRENNKDGKPIRINIQRKFDSLRQNYIEHLRKK